MQAHCRALNGFAGVILAAATAVSGVAADSQREAGRRLYEEGILPDGNPLTGVLAGSVEVSGVQFACANCHRPSGFGVIEGEVVTPSITAATLAQPAATPNQRAAYDEAALMRALRDGVDPSGRALNAIMPRYKLDDASFQALAAHLKTLGAVIAPGVGGRSLKLAVVIDSGADPREQAAVVQTTGEIVNRHNSRPWGRGHRKWEVEIWRLGADMTNWRARLEKHLKYSGGVFAIVGGLARDWRPIHEFSESHRLPCLFPNTSLPHLAAERGRAVYFSRGCALEGGAMATWLKARVAEEPDLRIVQIVGESQAGRVGAAAFDRALGAGGERCRTVLYGRDIDWSNLHADIAVLWLASKNVGELLENAPEKIDVLVSAAMVGDLGQIPNFETGKLFVVSETSATDGSPTDSVQRVQANTRFVWQTLELAVEHLGNRWNQDLLLEKVEMLVGRMLESEIHERISLGSGQRYAAKGASIFQLSGNEWNTVAEQLVPDVQSFQN